MTPYHSDPWLTVYQGDCREVMASMEPESVHCVVTSPPYWGLRDYGDSGQLGLEPTPEEYVANMVEVFREVRRVLRSDGTVWLNLGDSYAGSWGARGRGEGTNAPRPDLEAKYGTDAPSRRLGRGRVPNRGVSGVVDRDLGVDVGGSEVLKGKDLVGIPWRVAFALQADGWYLRSDIIWSKPNPMPESVTDRPTKSHEYLFLLTKSARYYFDADAVREEAVSGTDLGLLRGKGAGPSDGVAWHAPSIATRQAAGVDSRTANPSGARNIRSVWTVATQPYPGAHFATFPEKLIEPCIKAGTSEKGVCPECGAPWERVVERQGGERYATGKSEAKNRAGLATAFSGYTDGSSAPTFVTTGWDPPACGHHDSYTGLHEPATPAVVLDPFGGSGTTARVAQKLGRRAVLIDLNADYLVQAMKRNQDVPLGLDVA